MKDCSGRPRGTLPRMSQGLDSAAEILATAREILPWMTEIRRDLHQHPELGLEEHRTAKQVQERLDELGIEHVDGLAQTGVLGLIRGHDDGPTVALRADLDALPLQDAKDVPYKSQEDGKMHACGHDVHTSILLGAAKILKGMESDLSGTVKLIFQPAEETVGGARLLIEEGVLENPTGRSHLRPACGSGSARRGLRAALRPTERFLRQPPYRRSRSRRVTVPTRPVRSTPSSPPPRWSPPSRP